MKITDIKNLDLILQSSHQDPGKGGRWLETLWESILTGNPDFNVEKSFQALLVVLKFLIDRDLAYLMKYDEKKREVVLWKGGEPDVLMKLKDYLSSFTEKKIEKYPIFLDMFEYPAIDWQVEWPLDFKQYGIDTGSKSNE